MPQSGLNAALAKALPDRVFFAGDAGFAASIKSHWSARQRDIVPACIVRPETTEEVSTAIKVIKDEYDLCVQNQTSVPVFAIRSGGHSVVPGHANASDGINLDLSHSEQIEPAGDGKSVVLGCAARWGEVAQKLAKVDLAVAGGRNSDVGVGGLTLGGGYSFFSPQTGFVCDNVVEFHVVLASGEITVASQDRNADLWRALKGGGNNFGIVTHFRFSTFQSTDVWAGFLYMFSGKAPQAIRAFSEHVNGFDEHAAGPLLCFGYVQQIVLQPVHTATMAKGQHDALGLSERQENLVVVLFTAAWSRRMDDRLVDTTGKTAIDEIDDFAKERKSDDGFRYMNWAPRHQNVFESYGKENYDILKGVSSRVDPDGLFQRGCAGGFKLSSGGEE